MGDQTVQGTETVGSSPTPQVEGRRTQLKAIREGIESLTTDVWKLSRSHDSHTKKLEKEVATLRKDLSAHVRSKEVSDQLRTHASSTKSLERQVAALRKELADLKGSMAKEAARVRARDEASYSKLLAKVSPKKRARKSTKRSKK